MLKSMNLFVALILSLPLYAQDPIEEYTTDNWKYGEVILKTGDTISSIINYEPLKTGFILRVKEGTEIVNYNPRYVKRFSYYDRSTAKDRHFVSFLTTNKDMSFMEVLFEDSRFFILKAEAIYHRVKDHYRSTQYGNIRTHSTPVVREDKRKYIADKSLKRFVPLTKRSCLGFMLDKEKELKRFIYQNGLKMVRVEDYVRVINKYSELKEGR